ncbi:MAG: Acylaminoacyl-peptidase [Anaerolineales bacterium]|nr:Acylaminoacyl-peptidase [Anaerolineales bacterium]
MLRIESLLSARLFITPQLVDERLYFMSNLSGHLSLYAMRPGGSVPEPLLPPHIALQNPHLMNGYSYYVFPKLGKILVMIDRDGDENYQPTLIPLDGGFPEPAFGDRLANYRVHCLKCDAERNLAYFNAESRKEQMNEAYQGDLGTGTLEKMGQSKWGAFVAGVNDAHTQAILIDGYTVGDNVLSLWTQGGGEPKLLYGKPLETRAEGETIALNAIGACFFTPGDRGILFTTALFSDTYGLGYMELAKPREARPVAITGIVHTGAGELVGLDHLREDRYEVAYNIDGCSWLYEGTFDEASLTMKLDAVICGHGQISNGVLESAYYDKASDTRSLSFSTATAPTQIYTVGGQDRRSVAIHTRERVLGIPDEWLSRGEDASFTSYDGMRTSARLYLPAEALGFKGPRPLVYYVHGGPQGQERPDFAWFSMPLIQFLTLNGFAVFVPNVRGSTGYGLSYTKHVDRDWGGKDRLDHVHAMTQVLPKDKRLDVKRAGVVGRSYGGYMTLTLAARHPELWSAAVDMFGPYDLLTFMDRIPETWKPYFSIAIGDPAKDHDFLVERSPRTHIGNTTCPLLVIQGQNDPRVIERESRDVVEQLRAKGKEVDYLVFENEGHDVLKYENRVRCYNAITDFFKKHLKP